MLEYAIIEDGNVPENIVEAVERCGQDISHSIGIRLVFKYRRAYGFNVSDESGRPYVMNFDLSGHCSAYDGWEYGDDIADALYCRLDKLVAEISPDGQCHPR